MRDRILKVIFVLTILFVLYLFFAPYIIIELWNIQSGKSTMLELTFNDFKYNIDGSINKDKYNRILNEYIKNRFGDLVFEKLSIVKNDGNRYMVKFEDILDGTFFIQYHKAKGACSDNFYKVLLADNKFQHFYSEWVKKQIGIDDGNVELEFQGYDFFTEEHNFKIDFNNINVLDKDYDELFKNVKNMRLTNISLSNYHDLIADYQIDDLIYKDIIPNYYNRIKAFLNNLPEKNIYGRYTPYEIFIYINDIYQIVYDEKKKEIVLRKRKNDNPNDFDGAIWSTF